MLVGAEHVAEVEFGQVVPAGEAGAVDGVGGALAQEQPAELELSVAGDEGAGGEVGGGVGAPAAWSAGFASAGPAGFSTSGRRGVVSAMGPSPRYGSERYGGGAASGG
ncbi:hypothetical protein [Streptomyces sp. DfronAA-171]|uniref:hypothetical protein n=1 Tax=Streptomyces sp. DfronAA-171 TaxID=1839777 RepID=UPI00210AC949|nr:hypothetical protein [Streptomyces sp. DfronAA-171]